MKTIKYLFLILTLACSVLSNGQVVTIPIVVHVIYHDSVEDISYGQIQSEFDVLNADFRKLNADTVQIPPPFHQYAGDAQIEFCLAQRDTNGNATTGITRTYTSKTSYSFPLPLDSISHTFLGGENRWNPNKYLNVWIGNFGTATGTTPSELSVNPDEDGIYITYDFFGTIGSAIGINGAREVDLGIGSWLNLYHIWGDTVCGNDSVADTPPAEGPNYGCPAFPHNPNSSCGTDSNGEMTSNFMDYSDGDCKNFFTHGQIARMHAALTNYRSGLLTSDGCIPVGIDELMSNANIKLFPNPSRGVFTLQINNLQRVNVEIYNSIGRIIYRASITSPQNTIDLSDEAAGIYFLRVSNGNGTWSQKIIKK